MTHRKPHGLSSDNVDTEAVICEVLVGAKGRQRPELRVTVAGVCLAVGIPSFLE